MSSNSTSKTIVAIREYWPGVLTGEMESIARISRALELIGIQAVKVPVGPKQEDEILELDPLFVLDLHFEATRIRNCFSVGALWNPLDYYEMWGGTEPWLKQLQHDLHVSANPKVAEEWIRFFQPNYQFGILPLNHSVPSSSVIAPSVENAGKVFYAGIGWDRGAKNGHRHESIFRALDSTGLLELYGPEKLSGGVRPWKDFKSYAGQLPFDGHSLISKLNGAGFALCLSSESHLASEIASNRVFETIAAGAVPIIEDGMTFPFDLTGAVILPPKASSIEIAEYLSFEVNTIRANREDFIFRVNQLQSRLISDYTLDKQLLEIVKRVREIQSVKLGTEEATVFSGYEILMDSKSGRKGGLDSLNDNSTMMALNLKRFQSFLNSQPNAWIVFSNDDDYLARLRIELAAPEFKEGQVAHATGQYHQNLKALLVANDGLPSKIRTVDSVIFRAQLLSDWLLESSGCVSIGAFLIGLVEDSTFSYSKDSRHVWLKRSYFDLAEGNPKHLVALTSNLDLLGLRAIIRKSQGLSGHLAKLALQSLESNSVHQSATNILEALGIEVARLGLRNFIRQSISYFVRLIRSRK